MQNQILSMLNQQQALNGVNQQQVKQAWNTFRSIGNPQAIMSQISQRNPILGALLQRGTPKDAFFSLAQQKGIDPNAAISMIQRMLR